MAELLAYLARELVDDPDAVRVETEEREGTLVLVLHVAADDVGKVIGRQGRIARALRTLVRASAAREGRRVLVEIADPEMKVAALYDIHGMPWALDAVLEQVDADAIVVGGDFIYGPYPEVTLEHVRSLDARVVRGNCERAPDDWDRERLSDEQLHWAAGLPLTTVIDAVTYCHATPADDMPVTTAVTPDDIVAANFQGFRGTVVIGHTHHQFDRLVGDLRVINAGSVGMPYEGEVAAFWTLLEDGEPRPMRTPIDVERAVREIRASGWPNGESFVAENLLVPASREEAIAELEARAGR